MIMSQQIGIKIKNGKLKMDQVDIVELKNTMIETKNLLPELNGRLEKTGVRIGGPKNRTLEMIKAENQRGKNGRKMNIKAETVKHLHTYQHKGSLERLEREKRERKCIYRVNIHNFQN